MSGLPLSLTASKTYQLDRKLLLGRCEMAFWVCASSDVLGVALTLVRLALSDDRALMIKCKSGAVVGNWGWKLGAGLKWTRQDAEGSRKYGGNSQGSQSK